MKYFLVYFAAAILLLLVFFTTSPNVYAQLPDCEDTTVFNENSQCLTNQAFRDEVKNFITAYEGSGCLSGQTVKQLVDTLTAQNRQDEIWTLLFEFRGVACTGFPGMAASYIVGECKCAPPASPLTSSNYRSTLQKRFVSVVTTGTTPIIPTSVATPTTIPTQAPVGQEDIEQAVDLSTNSCGSSGLRCCIDDAELGVNFPEPELNTEAKGLRRVLDYAQSLSKGWQKWSKDLFNSNLYEATNGRLCYDLSAPEISYNEGGTSKTALTINYYDLENKSIPVDDTKSIPFSDVKDCKCVSMATTGEVKDAGAESKNIEDVCRNYMPEDKASACLSCAQRGNFYSYSGTCVEQESLVKLVKKNASNFYACSELKDDNDLKACIQCQIGGMIWGPNGCIGVSANTRGIQQLCTNVKGDVGDANSERYKCIKCSASGKIWTALGCVEMDLQSIIQNQIFGMGLGLAGLVALLCIIYSSFTLQTAMSEPERVSKAQEMMTSCITGLILIILSVFILNVIGVDLLRIPGFSRTEPTPTAVPAP